MRGQVQCCVAFYVLPVVCVVGLVANAACIPIFARLHPRSSKRQRKMLGFLGALAGFDALQLLLCPLLSIPLAIIQYEGAVHERAAAPAVYWLMTYSFIAVNPLLMIANYSRYPPLPLTNFLPCSHLL